MVSTEAVTVRFREVLYIDFLNLSCSFGHDTCLWYTSGNSTWKRLSDMIEATGAESEDQTFVLESVHFNATASSSLTMYYQIFGSSTVSLAVESQTEASGWTTIFLQTGDQGPLWHTGVVTVPDGTVAIRVLANITAVEDVARVDSLWASHAEASMASLGEASTCHDGPFRVPIRVQQWHPAK